MIYVRNAVRPPAIALFLLSLCAPVQAQTAPITINHDITNQSMTSDRFTWIDSSGQPRVAVLAHDNVGVAGAGGGAQVYGVAMREFQYQANGLTRVAGVTAYGNGGYGGFGYVVEHSGAGNCIGDDSPLGHWTTANFQRIFEGRHHVIFRYTQNYPRNCPNQARVMPVTYDFIFSTGRDNPIYAITYDVDLASPNAPQGTFYDDSRAPYGELNIDGDGSMNVEGIAWGDRYQFLASGAPLTTASAWTYNVANTIPFIKTWIASTGPNNTGNATMGLVQTQTLDQQDAGGARDAVASPNNVDLRSFWNTTSAAGGACPQTVQHPAAVMPCGDDWAYQALGDALSAAGTNNARITWKTQYGFVGPATYPSDNNFANQNPPSFPGYPKKSYSVYVVIGTHSSSPVEAQITQVQAMQTVSLTTSIGSVVTSGPAGITRADNVTYSPAGYNHVYGALAFSASNNQLDGNIALGAGTLSKPLIVVGNYTAGATSIAFNGSTLTADVDYFASQRTNPNELWITLNRNISGGTNHLQINPPAGIPAAPTGVSAVGSPAFVQINWNAVGGATQYELDRCQAGTDCRPAGAGWASISTTLNGTGYGDVVSSGTAYAYRVRAKNASGTSPNSVPDVATTVTFTDPTLTAGSTTVKAVHLAELRNALDLVRGLVPTLGAGTYTDTATAGTVISAVHITEIRTQLDQAFSGLGMPTGGYTDTTLTGVAVKAVHFQELRNRMQ